MPKLWSRTSDPLGHLAWYAATNAFAPKSLELPDRFNTAYAAILEAHQQGLTEERVLLSRASAALVRERNKLRSFRGQAHQRPGLVRNAVGYWNQPRSPHEERFTEQLAVRQVINALPDRYRQVLTDLAYRGIRPKYPTELARARQAAWALWYDQETPQSKVYRNSKK